MFSGSCISQSRKLRVLWNRRKGDWYAEVIDASYKTALQNHSIVAMTSEEV